MQGFLLGLGNSCSGTKLGKTFHNTFKSWERGLDRGKRLEGQTRICLRRAFANPLAHTWHTGLCAAKIFQDRMACEDLRPILHVVNILLRHCTPRQPQFFVFGSETASFLPRKVFIAMFERLALSNLERVPVEKGQEGAHIYGCLGIFNRTEIVGNRQKTGSACSWRG